MIEVLLNRHDFEYDIHSLVRAFYPGTEVSVHLESERIPKKSEKRMARSQTENACFPEKKLEIHCADDRIEILFFDADGALLDSAAENIDYKKDRRETKNRLKSMLYKMLSAYTGQELPWGSLTGIRPVKIAMARLEEGFSDAQIAEYMQRVYHTGREKAALAVSIANRERALLEKIRYQNGYSLYVGIPFCPSICLYCSFSSSPIGVWKEQVDAYLDALCKEIRECARIWKEKTLDTIYIGGGTPTTLSPAQLERLLCALEKSFDCSRLKEFTVEAGRPDSITAEKLNVLLHHPVSRISINPQTMNDGTLELIGRRHTVKQTLDAFALAREMGFSNINMDLIAGLPGEGYEQVETTMRQVMALQPDSLTVHSLAVKRAARLNLFRDQYKELSFVNSSRIMDMAAGYAAKAGLLPYYLYRQKNMAGNFENVGYARPGAEGLYNVLIMEEKESILALGAGASTKIVTKDRIERVENVKDIRSYIGRIDEMIARKTDRISQ